MADKQSSERRNKGVNSWLQELKHPRQAEINALRDIILSASESLDETLKWNSPNYSLGDEDRLTMRLQPAPQIQLILHRGAKKKEQPPARLIHDKSGLLAWKENDRAVITFNAMQQPETHRAELMRIVRAWLRATQYQKT